MMHRRYLAAAAIQIRSEQGQPTKLAGLACPYFREGDSGTECELFSYGNYRAVERMMPGCFDRACREDDVHALIGHDRNQVLGYNRAGTLALSTDPTGLRYEITLPDTSAARDLAEGVRRGDINGCSIGFSYRENVIREKDDGDKMTDIIEVHEVELAEVSVTAFPAYAATSSTARSLDALPDDLRRELESRAAHRQRNARGKLARARSLEL